MVNYDLNDLLATVGESVEGIMCNPDLAYSRVCDRHGIPMDISEHPIDVAEKILGLLD